MEQKVFRKKQDTQNIFMLLCQQGIFRKDKYSLSGKLKVPAEMKNKRNEIFNARP